MRVVATGEHFGQPPVREQRHSQRLPRVQPLLQPLAFHLRRINLIRAKLFEVIVVEPDGRESFVHRAGVRKHGQQHFDQDEARAHPRID